MAGTDRGAPWLAVLYGVSVATVLMLLAVALRARPPLARIATAGAVTVVALPLLIVGPLRHSPPPVERGERQRDASPAA